MVAQESLLVILVTWVDHVPMPVPPTQRARGRPQVYGDRLFLKALVIMLIRQVHTVSGYLAILAQPTAEMQALRRLLTDDHGRFPSRRTWERRLAAMPSTLPGQIGCLGRHLVAVLQPWLTCGRAAAIDSTVLRARGGVWHKKHREAGRTRPLIPKPVGQNPAGTAGSTAGSCIWFARPRRCGSRWPPT